MATPEKVPYWELLKRPEWQRKRLEIMQRDNFTCIDCDDSESTLNVHHRYYVKGRMPWDYPDFCLITLCSSCHEIQHDSADFNASWENITDAVIGLLNFSNPCIHNDLEMVARMLLRKTSREKVAEALLDGVMRAWAEETDEPPLVYTQQDHFKEWAKVKYPNKPKYFQ